MTVPLDGAAVARIMIAQTGWAIATLALALWVWKLGVRRFEAVGG
jgi:ABC-type uncharacterized transport system permease subunit